MKSLSDYITESAFALENPLAGESLDLIFNEELCVSTEVVESTEDRMVFLADETLQSLLESCGCTFEDQETEDRGPDTTMALLKGLRLWDVNILNNYYKGKYADYSARPFPVLASSASEAEQVVLDNADEILQKLLSMKLSTGKRLLPPKSALPITHERLGEVKPSTRTSMGSVKYFSPQGPVMAQVKDGQIVDVQMGESFAPVVPNDSASPIPGRSIGDDELSEGAEVVYYVTVEVPGTEVIKVSALGANDAREKAESWGYRVVDVKDSMEVSEAKYQGREVKLGKPMPGDVKKYKVYVRDPKTGNIKKVNFGDKKLSIKRDDPKRRKNFRARHNCAQAKDRTSAKYWSCRMWSSKPVSKILKGK